MYLTKSSVVSSKKMKFKNMKRYVLILSILATFVLFPTDLGAKENPVLIKQIKYLVKNTLINTIKGKKVEMPSNLCSFLRNKRSGIFITLKDKNGKVRACYGTVEPMEKNLAWEIVSNTKEVLKSDDRFIPLSLLELPYLTCYVSLVKDIEVISSKYSINPSLYGLRVSANGRAGVLLPGEAKTVSWQVLECLRKAGLSGLKNYTMERFRTNIFSFNFKEMIYGEK